MSIIYLLREKPGEQAYDEALNERINAIKIRWLAHVVVHRAKIMCADGRLDLPFSFGAVFRANIAVRMNSIGSGV